VVFAFGNAAERATTGAGKRRLPALTNATGGDVKVNPTWRSCAVEKNDDTLTLTAEDVQTVTWAAGDNDRFKEVKVTLAVTSTWFASIIWE
jgi:hypothetical protein